MLAATQRRHFSFYLALPLVVAIVPLLVAKLVALQRADIIAELADRVAHRESPEAVAALRQLTSMPRPPVSVLVAAATSADAVVAAEAKRCINRLLRRAQRHLEAERRVGTVSRQLAALAESLAAQRGDFSTADYPWLSSTTSNVLRLANRVPHEHAPLVAAHCDAILAEVASMQVTSTAADDSEGALEKPFGTDVPAIDEGRQSRQARLEREIAGPSEAVVSEHADVSERAGVSASAASTVEDLMNSPWRASWAHPLMRMTPAKPLNPPARGDSSPRRVSSPPAQPSPPAVSQGNEPSLAELDARELLRRWLDAEGSDIFPLGEELTRRGFGRLSERLVEQLFSPTPEARLRLVDDVLTEPGVDARPWFMLLSEDSDADVRLLAVTIMATSNDAALVEQAWQVSIRDRDPRIAGLAERLSTRREDLRQ